MDWFPVRDNRNLKLEVQLRLLSNSHSSELVEQEALLCLEMFGMAPWKTHLTITLLTALILFNPH
jgi:hypothetical protein